MVGTSQPILARLFTTCAPSGALATRTMASAPPFRRRRSWGLMSGSPQLNFSNPTGWAPSWPNHLVRPSWLLAPHGVFSRMMPGFFLPSLSVTCLARKWSTMSSLAETRNMKLGFRPFRVMPVAAAQGPTYGTFSSWNTGSIARPTGEWIPPNTTTAFSRSMTSRAAVTPFPGLPSSSRITSSILRPPSTPPLALISSMATVSPRLIASPESAEPPDMAATSATTTGGLACCAGAVVAVSATANVRRRTVRRNPERRIEPPELRLPRRWAVTSRPSGETVARRPEVRASRSIEGVTALPRRPNVGAYGEPFRGPLSLAQYRGASRLRRGAPNVGGWGVWGARSGPPYKSIQQHVVRACGAVGRLREIEREERIELHPAVGSDSDQTKRVSRRVVDAADRRVRHVEPATVERDVHHVGLDDATHGVVQARLVRRGDVPGLHFASTDAAHVEVAVLGRLAQITGQAALADIGDLAIRERPVVLAAEHPDRVAGVADVVAVSGIGLEHPARGQRDGIALQLLDHLACLEIPHEQRAGEVLGVPRVERAHERALGHPARGDHPVELRLHHRLVRMVRRLVAR